MPTLERQVESTLEHLIRSQKRIFPPFPLELIRTPPMRFDFSRNNPEIRGVDMTNVNDLKKCIQDALSKNRCKWGFGGWSEDRFFYQSSELFKDGDEYRSIHLGIDIWLPMGTPLYVPLDGRIHSFQNNQHFLDYGPTIITQHEIEGTTFHILYGHLGTGSIKNLAPGARLDAGDRIATIGSENENGSWPPHVHLEIITDMLGKYGDFPGVAKPSEKEHYLKLCPNPEVLLERFL